MFWRRSASRDNIKVSEPCADEENINDEFAQYDWPKELFDRVINNKRHDVAIITMGKLIKNSNASIQNIGKNGSFQIEETYEFESVIYESGNDRYPIIATVSPGEWNQIERKGELVATADRHVGYFGLNSGLPSYEIMAFFGQNYSQFFRDKHNFNIKHNHQDSDFLVDAIPCVDFFVFGCYWDYFCKSAFNAVRNMRTISEIPTVRFFTETPSVWEFEEFSREEYYTDRTMPIDRFLIRENYESIGSYTKAITARNLS